MTQPNAERAHRERRPRPRHGAPENGRRLEDLDDLKRSGPPRPRAERDEFLDLLQRTRADFENYQKRIQRDLRAGTALRPQRRWPLDLLPVLDNLDRATAAAKQAGEKGPLVQGVAMVQAQLLDVLRRHGITPHRGAGQAVRPEPAPGRHAAAVRRSSRPTRCCRCWSRAS